jgi:hypothetical protein
MKWLYNKSKKCHRRVALAEVDTSTLKPGTIKCPMQTTLETWIPKTLTRTNITTTRRLVKIPIWVRETAGLTDGATTMDEIIKSGVDYWVSAAELKSSDLNVFVGTAHETEWLAFGRIPLNTVVNVMPYDGQVLHQEKGLDRIRSTLSRETFLFNWTRQMWLHDPDTTDWHHYRLEGVDECGEDDEDDNDSI